MDCFLDTRCNNFSRRVMLVLRIVTHLALGKKNVNSRQSDFIQHNFELHNYLGRCVGRSWVRRAVYWPWTWVYLEGTCGLGNVCWPLWLLPNTAWTWSTLGLFVSSCCRAPPPAPFQAPCEQRAMPERRSSEIETEFQMQSRKQVSEVVYKVIHSIFTLQLC